MFRILIAFVMVLTISIAGIVEPAYAYATIPDVPVNSTITINQGNDSLVNLNSFNKLASTDENATNSSSEVFADRVIDGVKTTAGYVIGGAIACYALDGFATLVFPPAAALSAFCPGVGAAAGGAKAFVRVK